MGGIAVVWLITVRTWLVPSPAATCMERDRQKPKESIEGFAWSGDLKEGINRLRQYARAYYQHYEGVLAWEFSLVGATEIPYLDDVTLCASNVQRIEDLKIHALEFER